MTQDCPNAKNLVAGMATLRLAMKNVHQTRPPICTLRPVILLIGTQNKADLNSGKGGLVSNSFNQLEHVDLVHCPITDPAKSIWRQHNPPYACKAISKQQLEQIHNDAVPIIQLFDKVGSLFNGMGGKEFKQGNNGWVRRCRDLFSSPMLATIGAFHCQAGPDFGGMEIYKSYSRGLAGYFIISPGTGRVDLQSGRLLEVALAFQNKRNAEDVQELSGSSDDDGRRSPERAPPSARARAPQAPASPIANKRARFARAPPDPEDVVAAGVGATPIQGKTGGSATESSISAAMLQRPSATQLQRQARSTGTRPQLRRPARASTSASSSRAAPAPLTHASSSGATPALSTSASSSRAAPAPLTHASGSGATPALSTSASSSRAAPAPPSSATAQNKQKAPRKKKLCCHSCNEKVKAAPDPQGDYVCPTCDDLLLEA